MKNKIISMALLFLVILFTGCSSKKIQTRDIGSEYQLNGKWVLEILDGRGISESNFGGGLPWMELKINSTVVQGNTGCNTMTGSVYATSTSIIFENIITTMIACNGDGISERKFLDGLGSANNWQIKNEKLHLQNDKKTIAVFARMNDD